MRDGTPLHHCALCMLYTHAHLEGFRRFITWHNSPTFMFLGCWRNPENTENTGRACETKHRAFLSSGSNQGALSCEAATSATAPLCHSLHYQSQNIFQCKTTESTNRVKLLLHPTCSKISLKFTTALDVYITWCTCVDQYSSTRFGKTPVSPSEVPSQHLPPRTHPSGYSAHLLTKLLNKEIYSFLPCRAAVT